MNPTHLAVAATLAGGALLALQAPTNAALARSVGSPVNAALVSFAVGTVGLLLAAALLGARPDMAGVRASPWWAWVGGLYGAVLVAATAYAAPRLGVAATLTLVVAGQFVMAVALDHYGALGLAPRPLTLSKLAGLALIGAGVLLVRRP
ncbi:MAG: DMT family transporter [Pseudomonadota bacterium]|nr:DMT family transporter [Pseudomonadota bacterium]